MKRIVLLMVLAIFTTSTAFADYDPALEAAEQAHHQAEQRAEQQRKAEAQKIIGDARAKANKEMTESKRNSLGALANGKSDAEVNRLYDANIKSAMEDANKFANAAKNALGQGEGQGEAIAKGVTGKSMDEMMNMSDDEVEALGREMEKKYGK